MSKPFCPICEKEFKTGMKFCPNDGAELVARTTAALSGKVFAGRYTILGKLGSGGMGVVYKARQNTTGKTVAIKVISKKMTADPENASRFQREMRIQSRLEHPNILTVYDFDKTNEGQFFLVMPFVEGKSLEDLSREMGAMDIPVFLELAYQILDGVEYAHRKGIIHRDLKAENIIVTEREGQLAAMILDFGIAKAINATVDSSSLAGAQLTRDGVILGTPAYMSPEQSMGHINELGAASDIYSLGIIFFQMITGRLPFQGETPMRMIQMQIKEQPPRPAGLNPKIPKALETIVLRCLKKAPDKRYPTAGKLKEALEGLDIKAGKSNAKATMAAIALIKKSREGASSTPPAEPSRRSGVWLRLAAALFIAALGAGYYLWRGGALDYLLNQHAAPIRSGAPRPR